MHVREPWNDIKPQLNWHLKGCILQLSVVLVWWPCIPFVTTATCTSCTADVMKMPFELLENMPVESLPAILPKSTSYVGWTVDPAVLRCVMTAIPRRAQACLNMHGGHFQHLH
ncbi:uncharacterized protein TNCV_290541 [Trichonephila clavipes]|nr:uncharacterized protein TNCV_290541 [Trichonephila clavipes]